jgi:regulator of replication initiation timing
MLWTLELQKNNIKENKRKKTNKQKKQQQQRKENTKKIFGINDRHQTICNQVYGANCH